MRAVQIQQFGGPEVLKVVDLPTPTPANGEVLIKVNRAGVNFADVHQRTNEYLAESKLPLIPGVEVAGINMQDGSRVVAYVGTAGYAEYVVAPAERCISIPEGIDDGVALALLIQGLTAYHLIKTAGRIQQGETVVVHSAAGGVGTLATQLARPLGAGRVIATASTESKCQLALKLGADVAIDGSPEGLTERLLEANAGKPVDVVLEMAGGEVFENSLLALAPFGRIVAHGIATKQKNSPSTARLMRGSQAVVGFWFRHLLERPQLLEEAFEYLFKAYLEGKLEVVVGNTYKLADAAQAQIDLAGRNTVGKLLLDPTA